MRSSGGRAVRVRGEESGEREVVDGSGELWTAVD